MGFMGKLKNRMGRNTAHIGGNSDFGSDKDSLTVSTSSEEPFLLGESSKPIEEMDLFFVSGLTSSGPSKNRRSHGKINLKRNNRKLFDRKIRKGSKDKDDNRDDENHLLGERGDWSNDDFDFGADFDTLSDKENDSDKLGLLSAGEGSWGNTKGKFAYQLEQFEEEAIFEPSFDIALMDPLQFDKLVFPRTSLSASKATDDDLQSINSDFSTESETDSNSEGHSAPIKVVPQKRYDRAGEAFLHIFHDDLSTLYEEASLAETETVISEYIAPSASTEEEAFFFKPSLPPKVIESFPSPSNEPISSESVKVRARWEYSLALMAQSSSDDEGSEFGDEVQTHEREEESPRRVYVV